MINVEHLTKKYRKKTAVSDISFKVETGKVTGFVGPNGAGKSTTMRLMLGLDSGEGTTTYDDKLLKDSPKPSKTVGILLEAKAFHPTRSAKNHLKVLAAAGGIPDKRVDEVLDIVGLSEVAKKKPGKFSLGMSQRLGIAAALLGNPKYLILDEPANGLDPEGIAWLREFMKNYADKGNGVLISSHLLSEMSQIADNIVVIGKGKIITIGSVDDIISGNASAKIYVKSGKNNVLETALKKANLNFESSEDGILITGANLEKIGKLAFDANVPIYELSHRNASLEDAFLELTSSSQEYQTKQAKK